MTTVEYTQRTSENTIGVIASASSAVLANTMDHAAINNRVFMVNEQGVETEITAEMIESTLSELRASC